MRMARDVIWRCLSFWGNESSSDWPYVTHKDSHLFNLTFSLTHFAIAFIDFVYSFYSCWCWLRLFKYVWLTFSVVQDTVLKIVYLSWRYKIVSYHFKESLSCIFKILLKSISTKRKILFRRYSSQDTFCTLCKILHSNYITTITGMNTWWLHGITIILEHNSSNNSESTNTCKTNMAW